MGNEAFARGAVEGGVQVAASYPGTPASEIMETLALVAKDHGFHAEWSVNEKVAFEVAAGAALVGKRGFCSMKNAGLNWCMDMLCTITYGGVRGGLVVVVADDPSARTSSNEQDTRFASISAEIPCFEPSDQQEAKDMTKSAFELSETLQLPVLIRSVARISHSLGDVTFGDVQGSDSKAVFDKHWGKPFRWNVYGPPSTHSKHEWLHSRWPLAKETASSSQFNKIDWGNKGDFGVVAAGIAYAYADEALKRLGMRDKVSLLKLGTTYPIPDGMVTDLLRKVKKVLIVEEGEPFVEGQIRSLASDLSSHAEILGKSRKSFFPSIGELSASILVDSFTRYMDLAPQAVDQGRVDTKKQVSSLIAPRSSAFCSGCPHIGTWWAIKRALSNRKVAGPVPIINGDIGCYELAGYGLFAKNLQPSCSTQSVRYWPNNPYELIDTNYIMGGGIGLSQGMQQAGYDDGAVIAVAGDSTFFHACIPALVNAVWNKARVTFIVMDNQWTAMTGHQPHPGTGVTATGEPAAQLAIEDVCRACGVQYVKVVDPYDVKAVTDTVTEALQQPSVAVIVARRVCAQIWDREMRAARTQPVIYTVNEGDCVGCAVCLQIGCPSIVLRKGSKKVDIDPNTCLGCGICAQVCKPGAIVREGGSRVG